MATPINIELVGLRDITTAFKRAGDGGAVLKLAKGVVGDVNALKDVLQRTSPRSAVLRSGTSHMADSFTVSPLRIQGSMFTISLGNSKVVTSKSGTRWRLLDIVTQGWGPGARTPNSFVADGLHRGDMFKRTHAAGGQIVATQVTRSGPL